MLLATCSNIGQIEVDSIKIKRLNQHPTLADHDRKLITVDRNKEIIDELEIYPDSGKGCQSFLFDTDSKYLLIDCNGRWFSIDKAAGTLKDEGWKWNEKLPNQPLGKFQTSNKDPNYVYTAGTNFNKDDVYKYKDPRE